MSQHDVESRSLTIGQIVNAVGEKPDSKARRIEIPKFQRFLVWGDEQRTNLIDSIHRGFPIGALLLFERAASGRDYYQVVDGLQRTSTLATYAEQPLAFAPESVIPSQAVDQATGILGTEREHVLRAFKDWMRETKKLTFAAGFTPQELANFLRRDLNVPSTEGVTDPLVGICVDALDELKKAVDISGVSIPIVIYKGDESELPTIFERINQSGTKLNKYEVFAATWLDKSAVQIDDSKIRQYINDKYAALIDRGFLIAGLEEGKALQDFNLFEYLFGFGKLLVQSNNLLFRPSDAATETEPAGFSLACIVLGHQLSDMAKMPQFMPRASDGLIDPTDLQAAILEAAKAVSSWLRPYIGLKLNSTTDAVDYAHGELQIVSMIARAVVGRWETLDGTFAEKATWKADWARLKKAMPQHYLMDLLEETWRGPIYSTLFNRVWESDESTGALSVSDHYSTEIGRRTWGNALGVWFSKQLARTQKVRPNVRVIERTVLRFVYSSKVSYKEDVQTTFELEHLYPVSRLKGLVASDSSGWPISCISNLALFTRALNREKSAQTISEFVKAAEVGEEDLEMLDRLLLCDIEDVAIASDDFGLAEYEQFLRDRWETMQAAILKNLHVTG